jgi:hypothetical protein
MLVLASLLVPFVNIGQVYHMSRRFIRLEYMFVVGGFILLCGISLDICTQIYKFCMWYDFLMVWYVFMHSFLLTLFGCVSLIRFVIASASNILFSSVVFVAVALRVSICLPLLCTVFIASAVHITIGVDLV